jgi:hypothetical protein
VPVGPDTSRLESLNLEGVPRAYILHSGALERILFDRNLIGAPYADACSSASESFITHFQTELVNLATSEGVAELVLLSKGLCYSLGTAFRRVTGRALETNVVATSRGEVSADSASIAVTYTNFDAGGAHLIIGDTVATGASICAALEKYSQRETVASLHLFTIVGSVAGTRNIANYCASHGIALTVVFGLAAFGLGSNGFDLPFQHPDTVTDPAYVQRANAAFEGKPVSAAGWDFGSQFQAIRKYRQLCWLEARYWGLEASDVFRQVEEPRAETSLVGKEYPAYASAPADE